MTQGGVLDWDLIPCLCVVQRNKCLVLKSLTEVVWPLGVILDSTTARDSAATAKPENFPSS